MIGEQTNAVVATIPVGSFPFSVATNPLTNTIYVAGGEGLSVISGRTNTVVATIPVGGFLATNPLTNTTYVTNAFSNTVSVLGS